MQITKLTSLAFDINCGMDGTRHLRIDHKTVFDQIEAGTIFAYLATTLVGNIDLSTYSDADKTELVEEWQSLNSTIDAKRKFGVENKGLCLLMAYIIQGIQQRSKRDLNE
jgi:hypothetical protein